MIKALNTVIIALALILIPLHQNLYSFNTGENDEIDTIDNLPNDLDIHYTGKYCESCHKKDPRKSEDKLLKFGGDYNRLCKCHGNSSGENIHPVGITPSEGKRTKIPSDFPIKKGD